MTALEIQETRVAIYAMCLVAVRGIIFAMVAGFALVFMAVSANAATRSSTAAATCWPMAACIWPAPTSTSS